MPGTKHNIAWSHTRKGGSTICQLWHWLCAISFCLMCVCLIKAEQRHAHTDRNTQSNIETHRQTLAQVGRPSLSTACSFLWQKFPLLSIPGNALNYFWWLILGYTGNTHKNFMLLLRLPQEIWIFRLRDLLSSMINVFLFYFCAHFHSTDLPDKAMNTQAFVCVAFKFWLSTGSAAVVKCPKFWQQNTNDNCAEYFIHLKACER